jgi:hypothetical protein
MMHDGVKRSFVVMACDRTQCETVRVSKSSFYRTEICKYDHSHTTCLILCSEKIGKIRRGGQTRPSVSCVDVTRVRAPVMNLDAQGKGLLTHSRSFHKSL